MATSDGTPQLHRHFGLLQAAALNVSMIVGAGVFITIPMMLGKLPSPYAALGWLAAGVLMIVDGLNWSELGAAIPGSSERLLTRSGLSRKFLARAYSIQPPWRRFIGLLAGAPRP